MPVSDPARRPRSRSAVAAADLDAVVEGTRVVAALIAESLANLEPAVSAPQWRVLVLASRGCNVSEVAADLGVHMSNATRTCDRLVAEGLLQRTRADHDRRHVLLSLTPRGEQLVDDAMGHRRRRLEQLMGEMDEQERGALARSMAALVLAARVRSDRDGDGS